MRQTLMALLLAALVAAEPARASLGGAAASVEADARALGAVRRAAVDRGAYTVEEIETGAGTVREYVSVGGVVFAVSWNGVVHPDLDTLLGSRAAAWRAADRAAPRIPGRRSRAVAAAGVVVETWGHMRAVHGRAWDPSLLPPGVSPDELR